MNQSLQTILDLLQQSNRLTEPEKELFQKAISEADKQWSITEFKLDRTEKVKRTTAILLEETIEELEQKRKAVEAQNRELEIEAALEKIRTRSMAMQKSDELTDVAGLLFAQVSALGIKAWTTGFNVWSDDNNYYTDYVTSPQGSLIEPYTIDATQFQVFKEISNAKKKGEEFFVSYLEGELLKQTYQELSKFGDEKQYEKMLEGGFQFPSHQFNHFVFGSKVSLMFITYEPVPEAHDIFKRLGKVFEQTYTRFLDLQKAEAQAREALIEAALERVRAKAMAMQNSDELNGLIGTVFTELTKLDLVLTRCIIMINDPATNDGRWWMANSESPGNPMNFLVKHHHHPPHLAYLKAWQERTLKWEYILEGSIKKEWDDFIFRETELSLLPDFVIAGMRAPERVYLNASFNNFGNLTLASLEPLSNEHFDILLRFAKVFDLTYTRFNDIKQAEAQAREAQIEAALERVRSRTMAMRQSEELQEAATLLFQQVRVLGIPAWSCGYNIWEKDEKQCTGWMSSEGSIQPPFRIPLTESPTFIRFYNSRKLGESFYVEEVSGEALAAHYAYMLSLPGFKEIANDFLKAGFTFPTFQIHHVINFAHGNLIFITATPVPESWDVFKRFAAVFEQTYTRFLDLKKAEAQATEAVKQAALDRVRAEIASMRTTTDLERITPLIWNELSILGIPFTRCGVFIMDDEQKQIHTFLSTPDGKAIAAFHLPYNTPGSISHVVNHWQHNQNYIDHWDEAAFKEFAGTLVAQGALSSPERYLQTLPGGGFYLHFLPFSQGMLYVGNTMPLSEEAMNLVQSVAAAFSTAYARYEDFKKLEAAKQQVDFTLTELKATQAQLVQSEKMASLGELTAGIAHEIQNPLNFVNNFSETNTELLDELKEEVQSGNITGVLELADMIRENEQKVVHHGKRADAIVKNMLQHSRASKGEKQLVDINALADEYLRLSYHGLRAKDKSFNADIKTDFDKQIGKVSIVPQDIGRVLLNLFNNAFYAVHEKTKKFGEDYKPTITVCTNMQADKVAICIADNGMGISKSLQGKIFQPFFTTKPTGQGTGLGLSLSYDIIKAHSGELKVESKEGAGATFIIILPA